nr:MAG TPA: hypothetical protein [Caudoviricetes sp.]
MNDRGCDFHWLWRDVSILIAEREKDIRNVGEEESE